jgi:hypothetical protein
LSTV